MPLSPEEYDEFLRFTEQMERETEELNAKFRKFARGCEEGLREIIFSYYPELEPYKAALLEQINQEMDFHMQMILEGCNDAFSGLEVEEKYILVFRQTKTDFEAEMAEARAEMHLYGKQAAAFVEDIRCMTNNEISKENFTYLCQQKVKEMAYKAFPEIVNFSANALRIIEYDINLHFSQFCVGFWFITQGYRYNRFGDGGTLREEGMEEE